MIRKFTQYLKESDQIGDLSEDKIKDILSTLKKSSENLNSEKGKIDSLIKELELYTSNNDKNDQIDDTYISLQEISSLVSESVVKIGEVDTRMSDYLKNGRQYLY